MFARLIFGLVLGLLMYRPRPVDPGITPPGGGFDRDVPPTAPPGYEGVWPPASERPAPPTPPPGHRGSWPPDSGVRPSFIDRIRELLRELRRPGGDSPVALDVARSGADQLRPAGGVDGVSRG